MSEGVRVRRLVMFKHGVAYVERGGPASGDFELPFKRDEMNDVLKSLSAWVASGEGRVGAVAFEAPDDPREALSARNLAFDPGAALRGLFDAVRGRAVEVDVAGRTVRGEVIGLEQTPAADGAVRRQVVLRTAKDSLVPVDLAQAEAVRLCEGPSRADLELLVDRSRAMSAGSNRSVRVSLEGRALDLRVTYVIPSPIWRVSYRLLHEAGETVIMAWGIVHNPVDEDLDDVELTLTTGQPVSFVIDLYEAKHVARVVVEESSRAAAAPREYERGFPRAVPMPQAAAAPAGYGPPPAGMPPPPLAAPSPRPMRAMEAMRDAIVAAAGAAEGVERGELFEYRVATPVSLKRGGSAMVPIGSGKLGADKQRLWRPGQGKNPDIVLRFDNETGLVLEEGPAVIYDEGGYAGEAMMPYTARGAEVKLAFAQDLAVRCREEVTSSRETVGVRVGDRALVEEVRDRYAHKMRAESDHQDDVEVIFEVLKTPGRKLAPGSPEPFEETASYWRFKITVPGHGAAQLMVEELARGRITCEARKLTLAQLERWSEGGNLGEGLFEELSEVVRDWEGARQRDEEQARVGRDRQASIERQKRITEQLAVLRDSGDEGQLRRRFVAELGQEQDLVRDLEKAMRRLESEAARLRQQADERLSRLGVTEPR